MATQIEAARHLVYHAAWLKDRDESIIKEALWQSFSQVN